jgi:hypothetical protein
MASVPRHVARKDAPRGRQGRDEWEACIPHGREPFRLEPDIPAVAGERVLKGCTGSGLLWGLGRGAWCRGLTRWGWHGWQRWPIEVPQGVGGGLGGTCKTAKGHRQTEGFHLQALP